jgi:hypothetical protein
MQYRNFYFMRAHPFKPFRAFAFSLCGSHVNAMPDRKSAMSQAAAAQAFE